jgi:5-methyltetrahydrofolate--homocysteine methyltransferase
MNDEHSPIAARRTERLDRFVPLLRERILVLDGAMGTMIQEHRLDEAAFRGDRLADHDRPLAGDNDILCLTRPEFVKGIHRAYLAAGSDIVETNSFNATSVAQMHFGTADLVVELNEAAARIAREVADEFEAAEPGRPRYVAGALGPTHVTASVPMDVMDPAVRGATFAELRTDYADAARGLVSGGADLLLVETVFDTLNAKAALAGIEDAFALLGERVPIMVSGTVVGAGGRNLTGQSVEALWASVEHASPISVGLNCAAGAAALHPFVERLARVAPVPITAYPNAGLPDSSGTYGETPEVTAAAIGEMARAGLVNVVGGCCGTTPDHTRAIAAAVRGVPPRLFGAPSRVLHLAGLDALDIVPGAPTSPDGGVVPLVVGDRSCVDRSDEFARAITDGEWADAVEVAREQVGDGARMVAIAVDEVPASGARTAGTMGAVAGTVGAVPVDGERAAAADARALAAIVPLMHHLVATPRVSRAPVIVLSGSQAVLEAGLACLPGRSIVGPISLAQGESGFGRRARAIWRLGGVPLVAAEDEQGPAESVERRVAVLERAAALLRRELAGASAGARPFVLDVGVHALPAGVSGASAAHARCVADALETAQHLRRRLPDAVLVARVSDATSRMRGDGELRAAIHAIALERAGDARVDIAIVDPAEVASLDEVDAEVRHRAEAIIGGGVALSQGGS